MRCIFWCWLFLSSWHLSGSVSSDSCTYRPAICEALILCEQQHWTEALHKASLFAKVADEKPVEETVVAWQIVGDCQLELFDYKFAKQAYEQAYDVIKSNDIGSAYRADVLQKLGNYYLVVKDFLTAIPYLDSALYYRVAIFGGEHEKVGDVFNNLGVAYLGVGDFAQARDYHQRALSIRKRDLPRTQVKYAQSLNNLALCHQDMGELSKALDLLNEAKRTYTGAGDAFQKQIADVFVNLGNVQSDLRAWDPAIAMYKEAAARFGVDLLAKALCYNNMANAYTNMDVQKMAMYYYAKALNLRKEYLGLQHPDVAQTYFNIGMNHFNRGLMQEALQFFDSCALAVRYDIKTDPELLLVNDFRSLLFLLYRKAEVYRVFYQEKKESIWLQRAADVYEQLDVLFDHLRSMYKSVDTKRDLLTVAHHVYDQGIQVCYDLFSLSGEARHLHLAFKYTEKSKGVLLLEALQKAKANSFLNIPQSKLDSISGLEHQIANLEKNRFLLQHSEHMNSLGSLDSLESALLWSKRELSSRIQELAERYPAYHALQYETVPPTIAHIQQHLIQDDESLISYFLGEDYVLIFLINSDNFQVRKVRIGPSFFGVCNNYLKSIQEFPHVSTDQLEENIDIYIRTATSLREALIDPIKVLLQSSLIIVPDGQLALLPFESLLTDDVPDKEHFREFPYLIKSHPISYNYSVRALVEMQDKEGATGLKPYLGMAPTFSGNSPEGLLPLVHNQEEVAAAKATLGGRILLAEEASKEAFLSVQSNYRIVHLATHALANGQEDDFSFIAFEDINNKPPDQSLLYVRELYNLSAPADLIILSACETAAGRLYLGDGIASIARGFSFAGARSLLATRWNINDKTTQVLMHNFLQEIKAGNRKHRALQGAVTSFITEGSHYRAHPFYWSSFMVVGSMEAIEFSSFLQLWPFLILVFLILIIFSVVSIRKASDKV
ncbi:MAG: CHAT domain-containing protein [Saprospiraceae bacterium]|nr:CHAT domain-containing protein [Saprospiraceae bacterium]